jgi:hypothetical protein
MPLYFPPVLSDSPLVFYRGNSSPDGGGVASGDLLDLEQGGNVELEQGGDLELE